MEFSIELVNKAKSGSAEAFGELYKEIYVDLCRYAFYVLGNNEDVKDVVSEAVLDAYKGIGGLKDSNAFGSWMFRIVSAKCKKMLSQYAKRNENMDNSLSTEVLIENNSATTGQEITNKEEHIDLSKAFLKLNPADREIISLSVFAGYKSKEIGKLMNMNSNTVRTRLKRALEDMKKMLNY